MDFDDLKELGGGILAIVALFVVLGAAILLAMKLDDAMPTSENKHVPLDSGVVYEKYEISGSSRNTSKSQWLFVLR
jgi:hypothetical protein